MFYKDEKLVVLIDGVSLHVATKLLGFDVDYKLLRQEFSRRGKLVRMHYYTSFMEAEEFSPVRPLVDWLSYNGYIVHNRFPREIPESAGKRKTARGSIEVDLTVDAIRLSDRVDHIVLITGNGDFRSLVEELQRRGVRVTIVSSIRSQPSTASDDLRRQADSFVELDELRTLIAKERTDLGIKPQEAVDASI